MENAIHISSRQERQDRREVCREETEYLLLKRCQDVFFSVLALLLLWPVMALIALAIVIDSPGGSPLFVQTRIGRDGKPFRFYKFRSMHPGAESMLESLLPFNEMDGPCFKIRQDPRITRVGRFLRRTGMDELPQLINVIKGEMSLVGPRPGLPREVAQYDDYARQRLQVTPGITCFWQVQPDRNRLGFSEWMALDMQYIHQRSVWTDWKILLATVGAVLSMNGE